MLNNELVNLIIGKFGVERAISYLETQIYILQEIKLRGVLFTNNEDYDLEYFHRRHKELTSLKITNEY